MLSRTNSILFLELYCEHACLYSMLCFWYKLCSKISMETEPSVSPVQLHHLWLTNMSICQEASMSTRPASTLWEHYCWTGLLQFHKTDLLLECIIYHCSCRQSQKYASLNDCLLVEDSPLVDVCRILLHSVTDIEKAFLHDRLAEQERDFARFLWLSNPRSHICQIPVY